MQSKRMRIIGIAPLLALSGCQAMIYGTTSKFADLKLGMTKEEVIQTIGKPVAVTADGDKHEEYLIYKKMKHAISEWPRTYKMTFRDGKLVKWDEEFDEKNVNNY